MYEKLLKTTSWHWLGTAVTVSVVIAGVWTWQKVTELSRRYTPQVVAAERRLSHLEALDPIEIEAQARRKQTAEEKLAALQATLDAEGVGALPKGQESVFTVQRGVLEALVKRQVRVLESSAVAKKAGGARSVVAPKAVEKRQMTAAEYRAEAMKQVNSLDPQLRDTFLRDVERKVKQMQAAEAAAAKRQPKAAPVAAPPKPRAVARQNFFKTDKLHCVAEGRFADVFLFFVEESYKKEAYNFADISLKRLSEESATVRLEFDLQVNYK